MPKFADLAGQYASMWDATTIRPEHKKEIADAAAKLMALKKPLYDDVEKATGVPWYVVGVIHYRESDFHQGKHLHNGDPLSARTVQIPAGHPKEGQPPFTWTESAIDALTIEGFRDVQTWTVERIAYQLELYNGWGYRSRNVNTPYLWCCTDQYEKGYFVADKVFDPNAVNQQVGTLAILKQLEDNGDISLTRQSGAPPRPKPQPVPVQTGLFVLDGDPFALRKEARDNAERGLPVLADMPVKKIREIDATWWEVKVLAPGGREHPGFAKREWLKDQVVMSTFEDDLFAETCLSEGRVQGTNAHFLIALADAESGLQCGPCQGTSSRFGPFALTEEDWARGNDLAKSGYGVSGLFDPYAQVPAAASLIVGLTKDLQGELPDKRLPTSEELYLARIFGAKGAKVLLDAPQGSDVRNTLVSAQQAIGVDVAAIFAGRPSLLTNGITADDLRAQLRTRLDEGFKTAVDLIRRIEPDLVLGPADATDGERVPWMAKAKEELAKGVREILGPESNKEVEKYFEATTLGRQTDDVPWCAAFVSWCVKEAGGSAKRVTYSATAADWLNNGEPLSGPEYGAIAVTKPYAATSSGHVGFVVSWDGTHVKFLGGNQGNDEVCEKNFPVGDIRGWRML